MIGDQAAHWSKRNLPCEPIFHNELVLALCTALGATEIELHCLMEAKFLNQKDFTNVTVAKWMECSIISPKDFQEAIATEGHPVDGLFIWLSSIITKTHLSFMHESSVWTLQASDCPNLWMWW